jgi:hypothetical protein
MFTDLRLGGHLASPGRFGRRFTSGEPVTIALQDHHLIVLSIVRKACQRLASQAADLTSRPLRGNGALLVNTFRYGNYN